MADSLYQEYYKFFHKKMVWYAPILLVPLMLLAWLLFKFEFSRYLVISSFLAGPWIEMLLVVIGAGIFSMEFQEGTILTLLYKASNKRDIYFSKFLVIFCYDVILHVIAFGLTIGLSLIIFPGQVDWFTVYQYQQPLIVNLILTLLVGLVASLLTIALLFFFSSLSKNNSLAVVISFVLIFMGQGLSDNLLNKYETFDFIIKWNPLNMLNLQNQYTTYVVYHELTQLSNLQIIGGALCYTLVFLEFGYLIFSHRKF
ncbi:ABC transporter permease [Latilactobacillus fuchuensis]|uniref:ABC transporter permease n=1 Tax=Latilactobacillus fuchuensis TaxID=164393 RepID=A0A2N9DVG5_9LACO|nr:ABC transporter permease [Latilactobacillus fuchuensis]MCP8856944.1 ABC transporter permease [Latilactobacillus fuchuensis]SPC38437.1 conserved membrane hypothetical protein [Latilactobacillus fuchuensis]